MRSIKALTVGATAAVTGTWDDVSEEWTLWGQHGRHTHFVLEGDSSCVMDKGRVLYDLTV